jgi:hypothetical protein
MPPDHAGVECDDGDACARTGCSCWAVFYDGGMIESMVLNKLFLEIIHLGNIPQGIY